jgi:hypothetical protein
MSFSHTDERGARAKRVVYNPGTSTTRQPQGLPDEQHDSTPSQEPIPPEDERYQRYLLRRFA